MDLFSDATESVREEIDGADGDDSEKTNVTVIDSTLDPPPNSLIEPTILCAGDIQQVEIVDWEAPGLMSDLDVLHEQLKCRVKSELKRIRECEDASTARLLQQEKEDTVKREEDQKKEIEKLRLEIEDQNKALSHKDEVIKRLVAQIRVQKERVKLAKVFANWRSQEELRKRQAFCSKLAERQSSLALERKALRAWRLALESTWKERVQRVCRAKAEEVCVRLAAECEEKTKKLTEEIERLQHHIRVNEERQQTERDRLRAAVMRGVCALNLETIGFMQDADKASDSESQREEEEDDVEKEEAEEEEEADVENKVGREIVGVVARQRVGKQHYVTTGPVLRKTAFCGAGDVLTNPGVILPRSSRHRPIAGQEEVCRRSNPSAAAAILVERHHPVNKRTAASVIASHERGHRGVSHLPM